jgi:uncharacterized protein (TIGR02246 family)
MTTDTEPLPTSGTTAADLDTDADDAAIRQLGARWVAAFRTGDIEAFLDTYTDDAFLALAGQRALQGKEQIRSFFAPRIQQFALDQVEVSMQFERITIVGELAYTITLNWVTSQPASGHRYQANARSLVVYRRLPRLGWKMAADIEQRTPDADVPHIPISDLA